MLILGKPFGTKMLELCVQRQKKNQFINKNEKNSERFLSKKIDRKLMIFMLSVKSKYISNFSHTLMFSLKNYL